MLIIIMTEYKSSIDYLVREEGVSRETVEALERQGFRHTTMICPDTFEQMEYEKSLRATYKPNDIKIVPLSGGGKAYWVRDKNPAPSQK